MIKISLNKMINPLKFCGVEVEYASGKKQDFNKVKKSVIQEENLVKLAYDLVEYNAEFLYKKVKENIISINATFTPKTESVKDKIRKVTSLKVFGKFSKDALLVKENFVESKIVERSKEDKTGISEDFLSIYEKSGVNNAVTFTANVNAKFYSCIAFEQKNNGVNFSVQTTIPYTYEGVISSEEWNLCLNLSTISSLENSVENYQISNDFAKPIGWSTWDYFATAATEQDVKNAVDFISNDENLKNQVKYIALDDGWQQNVGDWTSGVRYPSGLKSLVSYINEKGYEAGIWLAPTRLHYQSATVMRRYDFLVKNEYGDPIMDFDMYILDPTHPDGEKFLRETFAYLKDCGFTFFKLDFVAFLLKCDRFYDKNAGHYDVLRKLFKIARECVGDKCHIMGCSLPYAVGKGVADSRRAGLDIHNHYPHLIKCLEIAWYQFPSNERLHRLDMDYLIVRGGNTSSDAQTNVLNPALGAYKAKPCDTFRWRDGGDFTYNEAKSWCAVVLLSGSSIFLGDELSKLNEKGLSLIYTTLKYADFKSATPILKGSEGLPEIWQKKDIGATYVFNYGKTAKEYTIALENGTYFDIFENTEYVVTNNTLTLTINSRDCACLYKK